MKNIPPHLLAASVSLCGCFAVVDVDHYRQAPRSSPIGAASTPVASANHQSLEIQLFAMRPHLRERFEFAVVDASGFVQSRGIVSGLFYLDTVIRAPFAIPKVGGPYRLDFYADVDESGGYNGIGSVLSNDHAWRIDPLVDYPEASFEPVEGLVQVRFLHNTTFTDIATSPSGPPRDSGLGATIEVRGLETLQGRLAQVRIAERASRHTVGLYRVPDVRGPGFDAVVPGAIEPGVDYDIDVYIDANANAAYESPAEMGGDLGWRIEATSTEDGLFASVDVARENAEGIFDVGAP